MWDFFFFLALSHQILDKELEVVAQVVEQSADHCRQIDHVRRPNAAEKRPRLLQVGQVALAAAHEKPLLLQPLGLLLLLFLRHHLWQIQNSTTK